MSKRITICGSTRFIELMAACSWQLQKMEDAIVHAPILLPGWYPNVQPDHMAEHEEMREKFDKLHIEKIDMSQEVFVVNFDNYVGLSTRNEVIYSIQNGKVVRWFTEDPIGEQVRAMLPPGYVPGYALPVDLDRPTRRKDSRATT